MFKKINQYLITHYPLIWNLKLIWIFSIGIIINCIAFLNGYLHFNSITQLTDYGIFNAFYSDNYVIYYFLLNLIILIIWFYFYIKNNRFKSKYPTSKNYLFKEFLGVFSIISLFISVPSFFNFGLNTKISNFLSEEEFSNDVDLINRVSPFTLQTNYGYSNYSRNLSVPIFDSLVSEEEVVELYSKNKKEYQLTNPLESYDSLEKPYFRNNEFNRLLVEKFSSKINFTNVYFEDSYYEYNDSLNKNYHYLKYYETDYVEAAEYEDYEVDVNAVVPSKDLEDTNPTIYSLYNYSNRIFKVPNKPEFTHKYYDEELIKILQANDNEKIEELLTAYEKKLDEYKIGYRFKNKPWIEYVNQSPYYFISQNLNQPSNFAADDKKKKDYVNVNSLLIIYENIESAKYQNNFFDGYQFFVSAALLISVIIITFRFTSFKVWLISLIGFGILSIIGACIGFTFSFLNIYYHNEFIIPLVFYLLFLIFVILGFKSKRNKIFTGVNLIWLIVSSLFIILLLISFYKEIRLDMLYKEALLTDPKVEKYSLTNHPEILKINEIVMLLLYINPLLYIIMFYFLIVLFKKWQALPEE